MNTTALAPLTRKDFQTDQEVRWCPGCGDYVILAAVQKAFAELGLRREEVVIVSGIGCSSRFPYYMNTFGFHTIHGRPLAVAAGLKAARPELQVWVVTGDGDSLSIGGNHLIHAIRRNLDVKVLLFNNRIYGLTKGQASPTSERHKETKSSPFGTADAPFEPWSLALGAGATFVARSIDRDPKHLGDMIHRAHHHRGLAFLEIYQNCNIFNDGAFSLLTEKATKEDHVLRLEEGAPLLYGAKDQPLAIVQEGFALARRPAADVRPEDVLRHREDGPPGYAAALAQLPREGGPTPIGVLRAVTEPTWEEELAARHRAAVTKNKLSLQALLTGPNTWNVH